MHEISPSPHSGSIRAIVAAVGTSFSLLSSTAGGQEPEPAQPAEPPETTQASAPVESAAPAADSAPEAPTAPAPLPTPQPATLANASAYGEPAAAPTPVPAEPGAKGPAPLKTTASFMTRYEVREGYKSAGVSAGRFQEGEAAVYRLRFGLTTAPIDTGGPDVVLHFMPQASGWIGQTSTIVDYELGLHEGYLRLQGGGCRFDVGRFIMDYGDALVIGNLGWHQTARAFEGMRARFALEAGWIDAFFTQQREGRPLSDPFGAGDEYFYGIYAGLGPAVAKGMDLDAYALGRSAPTTTGTVGEDGVRSATVLSGTQLTLGSRVKQKVDAFDYRLEAGVQLGTRPAVGEATSVFAYQADGEVGISGPNGFRFGVGGLVASGDDPTTEDAEGWDQLYPTAHKFLGLADVFGGRSNVGSLNGSLSYTLLPKLVAKVQGHAVWTLETPDGVESFAGTEIDSHLIYPMGEGLKLRTMYAVVLTNDAGRLGEGPVHYWEVELSFNLK